MIICTVVYIMMRSFEDEAMGRFLEFHDPLTGLPNRNNLQHKLEKLLAVKDGGGALILLDPTRLRSINTTHGRAAGDAIFLECANRLKFLFPEPNIVAVSSNGTFALYVAGIEKAQTVHALTNEIRNSLKLPITINSRQLYTNITAGAVLFTANSNKPEDLLNRAELALLEAKSSRRPEPVVYNATLHDTIKRRSSLETELQEVIELDKLEPFFQPLFNQDGKTLYGVEALARWNHPTKGWISPANFIPVAEELKLSAKLGCQIMTKACRQIAPFEGVKVSVNVTAIHLLQDSFVDQVRSILDQTGLNPDRLELEITESVLLEETEKTIERIRDLKALGVSIALDDFGTGYSGLSYLDRFSVDRIKIDASFVREIHSSSQIGSMVQTIIDLAHKRGFRVTVEGIETEEQFEFLKQFENLTYQGYLLSTPLSYDQLVQSDFLLQRDLTRFVDDGNSEVANDTNPDVKLLVSAQG